MLKDKQSIQVTIRVRPLSQKQKSQDSRICVDVEQQTRSISTFFASQTKKFSFDSICNNNTQEDLFQKVGKKSTIYCLEGYNCTIFAYGQTGSGKTFTMMGVNQQCQNYQQMRGLIPRTLQYLFDSIDEEMKLTGSKYLINCSFLQIYNQQIIDLLNKNNSNLQIREDIRKGVYVEGITEQTIQKGQEALDILNKGSKQRHVGSTCYNQTSSRSHSVFTMQIQSKHEKNGVINTKVRQFHFIDLAGSQRTSNINGDRLKEGCNINKSLMVLGKVINSLVQSSSGKAKHINYRDSKLTFLLKDSLGGNSKTHLIANVSPCLMSYNQTTNTLKFARRVKQIKVNKASINQDATGNLQSLKNQIKRLKQQIIQLRNGQIVPLQISRRSQRGEITSDTKMALMLNQYVSDQIDRQTKFQIQVSKLNKKVENLQNAIQKYSENQIQLRMIIKIYEDKIRRLKTIQDKIKSNQNANLLESSRSEVALQYLQSQRKLLLNEIESYKKLTSNQVTIKSFLKSLKLFENDQNLYQVLMKNGQFLSELKNQLEKIQKLKPNQIQCQNQIIQSKLAEIELQHSKKQNQYLQKIESLEQMLSQVKVMGQQNEQLLKEAVDHQINLQEKNKQQQVQIKELSQLRRENQQKLKNIQKAFSTLQTAFSSLQNEKKDVFETNQILKLEKIELQKTIEQQKKKQDESQKKWIQKQNQKNKSISHLEQENQKMKLKIQQFDKIISEMFLKGADLEASNKIFKESQDKYERQLKDVLNNLQHQKAYQLQKTQQIQKLKAQIQKLNQTLLQKQSFISTLQSQIQLNQKSNICLQKQSQLLHKSIDQCNNIIKQKQTQIQKRQFKITQNQLKNQQLQRQVKKLQQNLIHKQSIFQESQKNHNQKITELMNLIDSMQTSDNQNHQQINNIRISMIKLQESKQQSQYKLKSQIQKYTTQKSELRQIIQNLNDKLKDKQVQFNKQKNKVSDLKKEIASMRQTMRLTTIQMQQFKSESNHMKVKYQNSCQQIILISQKNKLLKKQLNESNKDFQQTKSLLKGLQNECYIKEKTNSIQKDCLQKQLKIRQQKYQNHIKQTEKQRQKLNKQIQLYVAQIQNLHKNTQNLKLSFQQTQKSLKERMDECLIKKQNQIYDLKQKNDQIKSELQLSVLECQKNYQQKNNLLQINKTLLLEKTSLTTDNKRLQTQIELKVDNQQKLIQSLEQLKNRHQDQLQQLQFEHNGQLDNKNQKIQQLTLEIQKFKIQTQNLQKQLQNNKEQLKERSNSLDQSVQLFNKTNNQLLSLKEKDQINNIEKQSLTLQILNLKKANQDHEKVIQDHEKVIQDYEKSNQQLKNTIQKIQGQIQSKQQQIHALKEINQMLQIKKLQNISKESLNNQISQLKQQNSKLAFQIQQLSMQSNTIRIRQAQTKALLQKIENKFEKLQNQLLQQKALSGQFSDKIILLNNQNESLVNQRKICESMIQAKQNEMKQMYKEIKNLNQQIQKINQQQLLPLQQHITQYQYRLQQEKQRFQVTLQKLNASELNLLQNSQQLQNVKQQVLQYRKQISKNRQQNIILLQDLCRTKSDLQYFQKENSQFRLTNESYRSLQSINKALGQKCQELQTKNHQLSMQYSQLQQEADELRFKSEELQRERQQLQKKGAELMEMQKKYNYERQLNGNLKNLIQNSQNQKRQLSIELQQKNEFYNQLLQKLAKNQNQTKRVTNSEHYVKTVQLLQKSRCQQVQLKKLYEQLKKNNQKLKQQLSKKQEKIQQIKKKSEQYCRNISKRNQDTENDYMELQKKYQTIYKEKKVFQKVIVQNQILKNANNRASLKIQDLQEKLKNLKCDYLQISKQLQESNKRSLYSGGEEKLTSYINKLKSELNDMKRQKQIISESLMKESNQKVMLKSQIRYKNESNNNSQNQIKSELDKRLNQIVFLKQIISEAMQACKINQIQPEPKLQILKNIFLNNIKQNIKQNQQLKRKIRQLQNELQKKSMLYQKGDLYSKDVRQKSNSMFTSLHQKYKQQNQQNLRQNGMQQNKKIYQIADEPLCNIMRTKINKTGSKYSQIRQSAQGTVLKNKDIVVNNIMNKNYQN